MPSTPISRADMPDTWPLTVESGTLRFQPVALVEGKLVGPVTFIMPDGKEYALNGIAEGKGYPKIDPFWADHPDAVRPKPRKLTKLRSNVLANMGLQPLKVDIGPLIRRGLALGE